MAIGIQQDGASLSAWAGDIALQLERFMHDVQAMQTFLAATPDATLEAAPYNLAAADVATLKSAFADPTTGLALLAAIYYGQQAQGTTPANFSTGFAQRLRGTSCL